MKNKIAKNKTIEKQLLPRLRWLGYLLIFFAFCSFCYALSLEPPPFQENLPTDSEVTSGLSLLSNDGRINAYSVAAVFTIVGISCMMIAAKRSRHS